VIRLHILADSDSSEDQHAKLAVRDGVKDYIYELVSEAEDKEKAEAIIKNNLTNIENKVKETVAELGYSYTTQVSFENEYYPVRYYESFAFPSGNYRSLKIILGSGEGKNWWCVLYPTVCNSMATSPDKELTRAGISEKTAKMICSDSKEYEYGLYILELFKPNK
jgi:stage II sporulation protein R